MTLFRFVEDFEDFGFPGYALVMLFVEDFGFPGYALVMLSDA